MNMITLSPYLPIEYLFILGLIILAFALYSILRPIRGFWYRLIGCALLLGALANPQIITQQTKELSDIAFVIIDKSTSQSIGERQAQIDQALTHLRNKTKDFKSLEVREIELLPDGREDRLGTRALQTLKQAMSGIDPSRLAGSILITDGQIHDLEDDTQITGPIHVLLSGSPKENDRRLEVIDAPKFALIDRPMKLRVRVLDNGVANSNAQVMLTYPDGRKLAFKPVRDNIQEISFTPQHAGISILELESQPLKDEISLNNNKVVLSINGIRDRLRVLLISGHPHQGQRTWRNILRSDPAVDLVHFTILRPSEKEDYTPLSELSLIAFPVRELFEEKLSDFDLVIFDRYYKHNVLNDGYFSNIEKFVREGGAVLVSAGPDFSGPRSLAYTKLSSILPVIPSGNILDERPFRLKRSDVGLKHPITADLSGQEENWGRWMRLVEAKSVNAQVVLENDQQDPVLLVNRTDKGRVAMLLSDHIWLWARGFDGGGPHRELVRHLVHWLMKEPDLEEERLLMEQASEGHLKITKQSLSSENTPIELTRPDGSQEEILLEMTKPGRFSKQIKADMPGIYKISDGTHQSMMTMGSLNPLELGNPRASDETVKKLIKQTGGTIHWITEGLPQIKRVSGQGNVGSKGWMGLKQNNIKAVIGQQKSALFPLWLLCLSLGSLWILAWWREGR